MESACFCDCTHPSVALDIASDALEGARRRRVIPHASVRLPEVAFVLCAREAVGTLVSRPARPVASVAEPQVPRRI